MSGSAGSKESAPAVEAPTCPHCAAVDGKPVRLLYRPAKGTRAAFYGCPNFEKHPNQRVIVDADKWAASGGVAATKQGPPEAVTRGREPGGDDE